MIKKENTYQCHDLPLAAFLRAKFRLKIINIIREGKRIIFEFDTNNSDIQSALCDYYSNNVEVKVRDFVDELNHLKSLIYNFHVSKATNVDVKGEQNEKRIRSD